MAIPARRAERLHEVVVFRVGCLVAALPGGIVEAMLTYLDITPVRGLPAGMLGAFEFRGAFGAVADLHWKLGLAEPPPGSEHAFIVVRLPAAFVALRVDMLDGTASMPASAFEMLTVPGSGEGLGYLRGVVRFESSELPLLDAEALVSSAAVAEVISRAA